MKKNVKLILIAGGTASGKTTIAKNLAQNLSIDFGKKVNLIEIDNYYFEIDHWKGLKENQINWDEPQAINWELFKKDLKDIFDKKLVTKKKFNYKTNSYSKKETITYEPSDIVIVEGIFALFDESFIQKADYKIFVDTDADVRFIRRMKRDTERHNVSRKDFFNNWINKIKPMHDKWIQPQKSLAQLVIQNNKEDVDFNSLNLIKLIL